MNICKSLWSNSKSNFELYPNVNSIEWTRFNVSRMEKNTGMNT
jgi:hypothetical protein